MKINILLSILTLTLLFACDPKWKGQGTWKQNQADSTKEESIKNIPEQKTDTSQIGSSEKVNDPGEDQPQHFICYKSDANDGLAISISYDENDKALKVKYKGQTESMTLTFMKENINTEGAYPTVETYYSEIYRGKENGVYKLTHSGNWDYVEYTHSKDGKKFNFTIDHDLTVDGGGYRTTPCF